LGYLVRIEKWAANLEEVTVNRWCKREGEQVHTGESLCEIITEKVTFEYEIPTDGILRKTYCTEGSTVPVGYAIAFISQADEPLPEDIASENADLMQQYRARQSLDLGIEELLADSMGRTSDPTASASSEANCTTSHGAGER